MSDEIRFGILGAARIAPLALVGPARRTPGVSVQAVAARDAARAEVFARTHSIPRACSYDALLDDPEIDAVYIALPNGLHAPWALRALAAGKHVLCEKPLASNQGECETLAQAAARPGARVLMEAFHNRYHPLVERTIDVAQSGALGKLRSLRAVFRTPMLRRDDIRFDFALGGGAAMDLGCYMVNLLRAVAAEEPEVISAQATLMRPQVDRRMTAHLRFPSGPEAQMDVEMKALRFPDVRLIVEGETGRLEVINPVLPSYFHRFTLRAAGEARRERFPHMATYDYQLRAFAAAVRTGAPFPTTAADAARTLRVIDAIYRAAGLRPRGLSD